VSLYVSSANVVALLLPVLDVVFSIAVFDGDMTEVIFVEASVLEFEIFDEI
jgi:hypothetical protein